MLARRRRWSGWLPRLDRTRSRKGRRTRERYGFTRKGTIALTAALAATLIIAVVLAFDLWSNRGTLTAPQFRSTPVWFSSALRSPADVPISGGTTEQRRALRASFDAVGATTIAEATIRPVTATELEEWKTAPGFALDLRRQTAHNTSWPDDVRSGWEQMLIGGRFVAVARRAGLPALVALRTESGSGPIARGWPHTQHLQPQPTPAAVVARLREMAVRQRIRVLELRASGFPFVIAVLQAADAATFLVRHSDEMVEAFDAAVDLGVPTYISVLDGTGRLAWSAGWLPHEQTVFATPELEACNPIPQMGYMYGQPPPPCPTK